MLQCNAKHKKIFSEIPMVSFRRAKSLCDMLVRARIPKEQAPLERGYRGCNGRSDRVVGVEYVRKLFQILVSRLLTGKKYEIHGGLYHCNSKNFVYLLECKNAESSILEVWL